MSFLKSTPLFSVLRSRSKLSILKSSEKLYKIGVAKELETVETHSEDCDPASYLQGLENNNLYVTTIEGLRNHFLVEFDETRGTFEILEGL